MQSGLMELVTVSQPKRRRQRRVKPRRVPRYHVILWNDEAHTYDYVVHMLRSLFGQTTEMAFRTARTVDHTGKAICLTTTLEHAELKRDQIHAFGPDVLVDACRGSMWATIEPAE